MSDMFSSEVELGKFLGCVDLIPNAYEAISKTTATYKLHESPPGIQILAFGCPDEKTKGLFEGEFDLVSSENHQVVDFISTEVNPKFFINKAAVEWFEHLPSDIKELEKKLINSPLVITGRGLGGYHAILFALRLHSSVDVQESDDSKMPKKRPICITFGSPLIGDEALQNCISERPKWESCFFNVVANKDPVASCFSSNGLYKPFGTFVFCTQSGGHTAFEDHESILAVLDTMALSRDENMEIHDIYGDIFRSIRRKALYRGVSAYSGEYNSNLLNAGIRFQLKEVGVLEDISNDRIIEEMEDRQKRMIRRKRNIYEPAKKLNDMKICMTYLEWYMKNTRSKGGYYDSFKNAKSREEIVSKQEIVRQQRTLNQYWKGFVKKTDQKPQKDDAKMRTRWLLNGHNYRRMFEPLDVADFYQKGNQNYIENRSDHYVKLEKLSIENGKEKTPSDGAKKAASLTKDSCFWAHVEEALINLRALKNGGSSNVIEKLKQFDVYMMNAIKDFSVSPDIFLNGSSIMVWWDEYKTYNGSAYASTFAEYMSSGIYIEYNIFRSQRAQKECMFNISEIEKGLCKELQLSLVDNSKLNVVYLLNKSLKPDVLLLEAGQRKPEVQWTQDERKVANLDQQLKSLIMSVLSDDQMNSVINCLTIKSTWDDMILYHEGPSDVKESRVMDLKLCYNTFKFKEVKL
nr:senescence-associated carboxylesterase 101-like [Tanacetum cinerariifolium]